MSHKVPQIERVFLQDQRTTRAMVIGCVDRKTTQKIEKKIARQSHEFNRLNNSDSDFGKKEQVFSLLSRSMTELSGK